MFRFEHVVPHQLLDGRPPTSDLANRRFLFVTGKGGVGKTTVTAAIGTSLAARGKRVLIAMCNTKERLSSLVGSPPIEDSILELSPNLYAVNLAPETAMLEYGEIVLKVKSVTQAVFGNRYMKSFLRAVPGMYEWAMLGKAWYHTTETLPGGGNRFDTVLFDAPATGHGLDMLRVPKVILEVVPPGVLRRDAEAAWALFKDPTRAGVVVVTLPEEMPTTETMELSRGLHVELGLPVAELVINGMLNPLFSNDEARRLVADEGRLNILAPARADSNGARALVAAARRALRERVQRESLERLLKHVDHPVRFLPYLFDDASTPAGTQTLANLFSPNQA